MYIYYFSDDAIYSDEELRDTLEEAVAMKVVSPRLTIVVKDSDFKTGFSRHLFGLTYENDNRKN